MVRKGLLPGGGRMHASVGSSFPVQKGGGGLLSLIGPKKHSLPAFSVDVPPHVHKHSAAQQMSAFLPVP